MQTACYLLWGILLLLQCQVILTNSDQSIAHQWFNKLRFEATKCTKNDMGEFSCCLNINNSDNPQFDTKACLEWSFSWNPPIIHIRININDRTLADFMKETPNINKRKEDLVDQIKYIEDLLTPTDFQILGVFLRKINVGMSLPITRRKDKKWKKELENKNDGDEEENKGYVETIMKKVDKYFKGDINGVASKDSVKKSLRKRLKDKVKLKGFKDCMRRKGRRRLKFLKCIREILTSKGKGGDASNEGEDSVSKKEDKSHKSDEVRSAQSNDNKDDEEDMDNNEYIAAVIKNLNKYYKKTAIPKSIRKKTLKTLENNLQDEKTLKQFKKCMPEKFSKRDITLDAGNLQDFPIQPRITRKYLKGLANILPTQEDLMAAKCVKKFISRKDESGEDSSLNTDEKKDSEEDEKKDSEEDEKKDSEEGRTEEPECGKVHLTVSPLDAFLELNWIEECSNTEIVLDEIILSTKNLAESDDSEEVLLRIDPSMTSSGYYKTKIKFGHPFLPGGWDYEDELTSQAPGPHCFPYWIASTSNKAILHSRCLAIQPTWMADNSGSLGSRHIETIMIPGTHNAGAYVGSSTFYKKFILNQDREIWTQLVFGIRYLDFRIAYYKRDGFYLNHDKFKVQKVRPLFQQIKKFLQRSPKEIVILDFHRFPYPSQFTQRLHTMFIDIVNEDLGEFAVPVFGGRKGPTLEEIWATNKSLIISYHNQEAVEASRDSSVDDKPWLWHPLPQQWANTKSLSALKKYMEKSIREIGQVRRTNPLWALMAELTPQPIDFVLGTYDVRKSAQDTNREINNWFRYEFGKDSNIVATDYFLGNDIIDAAIDINTGYNRSKLTS